MASIQSASGNSEHCYLTKRSQAAHQATYRYVARRSNPHQKSMPATAAAAATTTNTNSIPEPFCIEFLCRVSTKRLSTQCPGLHWSCESTAPRRRHRAFSDPARFQASNSSPSLWDIYRQRRSVNIHYAVTRKDGVH